MKRIPVWLLPLALAVVQLAVWPGVPLLLDDRLSGLAVATGVTLTLVVAGALLWRRSSPLTVLAIVVVAITVGTFGVPQDALLTISLADLIVLFGVAVLRPARLTFGVTAGVIAWQSVLIVVATADTDPEYPFEIAMVVVVYATVVAFGRARRRWHRERAEAAVRLAEAEDRRAQAADTERHRLARELHDVTAHHLTSIVVIASAAQRLGDTRPDLVAEARDFAARTGRETLDALHRLVALLRLPDERPGPAALRLAELAEGFRLLGQQVTVRTDPGELPSPATEAAVGITREALTNTLRYAPGSAVRIELTAVPGGTELIVDDDGARAEGVADLGSGRGVAGMRERATALGGTLTAGPRAGGGWRVRALLPQAGAVAAVRRRWRPGAEHVIDFFVLGLVLLLPVGSLLVDDDPDVDQASLPLLLLLVLAHAAPLVWRRRRPWGVLAVVAATSWAWPALIVADLVAPSLGWVMLTGLSAETAAVYAVARYGRRPGLSGLSIPAALVPMALATGATLALDPGPDDAGVPLAAVIVIMAIVTGIPFGLTVTAAWLAGYLARRRHTRVLTQEYDAVAASTFHAIAAAGAERARVAAGLREAVLRDTERVATAAADGDLDQVLESARAALDAMRGLLNGLREEPDANRDAQGRDPQPTTAALPGLADRWRGGGRQVHLDIRGAGRKLPADVDLSAFRVLELLLAGDTGPVAVWADLTGDPLRLAVRPMPPDEGGEVSAGLRARLAAVGGSMGTAADGQPEILLPAPHPDGTRPVEATADEEVASSPSA
ncbi:histidine kinase [Actinoplanes friuliensis]|uniref:histidine kinase n=1 Tax=Actinoplanes friuliensis DSM 7358 TaxID=1246995 RepID=U5W2J3_9ACTN|nr:histidine kinase [Actinoplanes friuliensis]AGZ43232.1 putative two-component system sensor kinase [Actinoplanes friuliensis DSM 7358]